MNLKSAKLRAVLKLISQAMSCHTQKQRVQSDNDKIIAERRPNILGGI